MTNDTITPDFSEALEFDDSQVPPGVYKLRVDSWQNKTAQASGAPYLSWKLMIFGAEGDMTRQNNRPVFLTTMLKGPGAGILKQFLTAALGSLPASFEPGWQNELIGKEIQATLQQRKREDGTDGFPNVTRMTPIKH